MSREIKERLMQANLTDLVRGYTEEGDGYRCIACGTHFEQGRIFPIEDNLYDAKKATALHIAKEHGSMLEVLLGLEGNMLGITGTQQSLLRLLAQGKGDAEASEAMQVTSSTIRNHRFRLREKESQARVFLAMMTLLAQQNEPEGGKRERKGRGAAETLSTAELAALGHPVEPVGPSQEQEAVVPQTPVAARAVVATQQATTTAAVSQPEEVGVVATEAVVVETATTPEAVVTEEAAATTVAPTPIVATRLVQMEQVTEDEKTFTVQLYFSPYGHLKSYPSKEKRKYIVLEQIASRLEAGKQYSEQELADFLEEIYDEIMLLRDELVYYGFLLKDGVGKYHLTHATK